MVFRKLKGIFIFVILWGNILPHMQSFFLVRPSSPSCAVHAFILEWSLPILPHVQSHPNMQYPVLARLGLVWLGLVRLG